MYSINLYIKIGSTHTTEFSLTARKTVGARLDEVNADQQSKGFAVVNIANGLNKSVARSQKLALENALKNVGMRKVKRKSLS